jgi:hypothetical protein
LQLYVDENPSRVRFLCCKTRVRRSPVIPI